MKIQTKSNQFNLNERTHIMGILNVTPDSFSDGGKYETMDQAVEQAIKMERAGADIIDIGGESTRPQQEPVPPEEEINRVVPVIEAIRKAVSVPISIDTYKAETARAALKAGAEIINDVWGALKDPEMAHVAARHDVPIILMHNRAEKKHKSVIEGVKQDLRDVVAHALNAGVKKENIILDPGVGFGKARKDSYLIINNLDAFHDLGYPVLLGASRKSFIEEVLPGVPPEKRDYATGATTCLAISKGVQFIRVHDVSFTKELALMMDRMLVSKEAPLS